MNFLKKILEVTSIPLSLSLLRQVKFAISRKELIDFALVVFISFLIVVYKLNKA